MKSFASSLHAFNQTYHSLQRSAGALLHHAGVILPALVGLYAVATNLLFIPLMQQLWSLTLRFAPVHYLNNSNASDIFVSPAIILCLVVIALLTAFWALYEFSVLLHGLELARSGRPVQLPALLRDALVDIRHTFLPQNWPVLVYSAVLIPFTSFFLTSNYVTQFAVPEYLLGVLRATTRYHALYLAIVVLLVLLFLSCALVLPLFVLERRSLWQAVRESVGFVRQRIFLTALLLILPALHKSDLPHTVFHHPDIDATVPGRFPEAMHKNLSHRSRLSANVRQTPAAVLPVPARLLHHHCAVQHPVFAVPPSAGG